ncbi:MAG: transglycosylase SLT domain-containing protein [Proteobacteria bacterium]|nr:transglycosylase SLT domain-containing protein [Pseudomonadota bacterium]
MIRTIAIGFLLALLVAMPARAQNFQRGLAAYELDDYETALKEFALLAHRGLAKAQHNLGLMYQNGHGLKRDDAKAVQWYRRAARQGTSLIEFGYPLVAFPPRPGGVRVDEALLLAMLRQESGFSQAARSGAGALGLMQLMPATAKAVARRLGLPYDKARLTQDRDYNLSLGRAYMAGLLDTYDGSYVLALAAYNGGERRVRFWIKTYGDPRDRQIDVIDWIESIPITETRNYVQRVMEAVAVYRYRLGRPVPADSLLLDLERGLR